MANILLRSPYYIYNTEAGSSYATLDLSVEGTQHYTITKDVDSSDGALFEISELARDYIDITFDGTYTSQVINITGTIKFYDTSDAQVGSDVNFTHTGFDGYGEFMDGASPTVTSNSLLQSNTVIYVPENTAGQVAEESSNSIVYDQFGTASTSVFAGGQTVTIERVCEPKYTPIKMTFVNKFGALQDMYFFKKSVESVNTTKETYKRSLVSSTGTYDVNTHSKRVLNTQGTTSLTMNTGFVSEALNASFEEMLLSEQVWATIGSDVIPVDITTTQLTYKTSVNDRLVNYTINVQYAFNVINDLR